MSKKDLPKNQLLTLAVVVIVAVSLRLYQLQTPLADWHSWRQADTASVTREYLKGQARWLIPEYHDLSNIPSGLPNPNGYRMVELPLINWLTVLILRIWPDLVWLVYSPLFTR